MVQGEPDGQVGLDAHGPGGTCPGLDLLHRLLHRLVRDHDEGLEPVGVAAAEVVGEAMVGLDEPHGDVHVVGVGRESGEHDLGVHPLLVHVPDAGLHVIVGAAWGGEPGAHELLEVGLGVLPGAGFAQDPELSPAPAAGPLEPVLVLEGGLQYLAGPADAEGDLELLPLRQSLAHTGVEVGRQGLRHGGQVRVRVEDLEAAAHPLRPPVVTTGSIAWG